MRSSLAELLGVGVEGLRGVVVNSQQLMDLAPALAEQLGLIVEG